jgi:hypothetical protein
MSRMCGDRLACADDPSVCNAGQCNKATGMCTGEEAAPDGVRCAKGSILGACVHGLCRQVPGGTTPTVGAQVLSR